MSSVKPESLPFAEATEVTRQFWRVLNRQVNSGPMVTMSQHLNGGTLNEDPYLGVDSLLGYLLGALWRE